MMLLQQVVSGSSCCNFVCDFVGAAMALAVPVIEPKQELQEPIGPIALQLLVNNKWEEVCEGHGHPQHWLEKRIGGHETEIATADSLVDASLLHIVYMETATRLHRLVLQHVHRDHVSCRTRFALRPRSVSWRSPRWGRAVSPQKASGGGRTRSRCMSICGSWASTGT